MECTFCWVRVTSLHLAVTTGDGQGDRVKQIYHHKDYSAVSNPWVIPEQLVAVAWQFMSLFNVPVGGSVNLYEEKDKRKKMLVCFLIQKTLWLFNDFLKRFLLLKSDFTNWIFKPAENAQSWLHILPQKRNNGKSPNGSQRWLQLTAARSKAKDSFCTLGCATGCGTFKLSELSEIHSLHLTCALWELNQKQSFWLKLHWEWK